MKNLAQYNRRDFLKKTLKIIPAAGLAGFFPSLLKSNSSLSRIVGIRDPHIFVNGDLDSDRVANLLLDGLAKYFDGDSLEGLRTIISPNDTVGIKVNCLSGEMMSTHPALVAAMVTALRKIGVRESRIIVWDRFQRDLTRGSFTQKSLPGHIVIAGNDRLGLRHQLSIHKSIASYVSTAIDRCDVLINMPVLKDHGIVGITLSMKNYFGAIHNPNKYHFSWDPAVADLYSYEPIRTKTKLTIVDALMAQYNGGPPYQPQWTWTPGLLMIGEDPVALDYLGWQIIEQKRKEHGLPTLKEDKREPAYIFTAAKYGLGNYQSHKIKYIETSI